MLTMDSEAFPQFSFRKPVEIRRQGSTSVLDGQTVHLSTNGLSARCVVPLMPGEIVDVVFQLGDRKGELRAALEILEFEHRNDDQVIFHGAFHLPSETVKLRLTRWASRKATRGH